MKSAKELTPVKISDVLDQLRSMLDSEIAYNHVLRKRIHELEVILVTHKISIPDYDLWHDKLPMA